MLSRRRFLGLGAVAGLVAVSDPRRFWAGYSVPRDGVPHLSISADARSLLDGLNYVNYRTFEDRNGTLQRVIHGIDLARPEEYVAVLASNFDGSYRMLAEPASMLEAVTWLDGPPRFVDRQGSTQSLTYSEDKFRAMHTSGKLLMASLDRDFLHAPRATRP